MHTIFTCRQTVLHTPSFTIEPVVHGSRAIIDAQHMLLLLLLQLHTNYHVHMARLKQVGMQSSMGIWQHKGHLVIACGCCAGTHWVVCMPPPIPVLFACQLIRPCYTPLLLPHLLHAAQGIQPQGLLATWTYHTHTCLTSHMPNLPLKSSRAHTSSSCALMQAFSSHSSN